MKRTAIAMGLGVMALPTFAQSSMTIFGVIDATVQHASQNGASINRLNGTGGKGTA